MEKLNYNYIFAFRLLCYLIVSSFHSSAITVFMFLLISLLVLALEIYLCTKKIQKPTTLIVSGLSVIHIAGYFALICKILNFKSKTLDICISMSLLVLFLIKGGYDNKGS